MPQLSVCGDCSEVANGLGGHIISDGGCKLPGDIAKALGAGAHFVMMGGMMAGHEESGGETVEENGKKYKMFYGMSSELAQDKHSGGMAKYRSSEGKVRKIPHKGNVDATIMDILGGLRSAGTYMGASRVKDFPKCCSFVLVNRQVNEVYSSSEFIIN
jgi:GMP reductase